MTALPVEKMVLHQPSLEEVAEVLQRGLAQNFAVAEVNVVDCPDLSQAPFDLAGKGLCGKPCIADVGGPDYLKPFPQKDKNYTFRDVSLSCDMPEGALFMGAGAGPHPTVGVNCELIANARLQGGGEEAVDKTRIAKVVETDGSFVQLENKTGTFSLLGNFFITEGNPGKVLQVKVSQRTGSQNFVECLHKTLGQHYGEKQAVGIGGTFLFQTGKANIHVMPDFLKTALETMEDTNKWLKFYEMDAPLIHVGEIVSADPEKLHLRQEHFHCFSHHGHAGHYHYDTTPDSAAYLGYFNVAEFVYRVDIPQNRDHLF